MDNFMDKLAQKLSAQEMIKANAAAEAAEMERLKAQVQEYEDYLQEMRKLNLRNADNVQKIQDLLLTVEQTFDRFDKEGIYRIEEAAAQGNALNEVKQLRRQADELLLLMKQSGQESGAVLTQLQQAGSRADDTLTQIKTGLDEIHAALADNKKEIKDMLDASDDFAHKENVKVYRNVQAAVVEELEKQTELIKAAQLASDEQLQKKNALLAPLMIATLVVALVDAGLIVVHMLGLF